MDEPELKIIDIFIYMLRKKLTSASSGKNYIETVWGRGYVLREQIEDAQPVDMRDLGQIFEHDTPLRSKPLPQTVGRDKSRAVSQVKSRPTINRCYLPSLIFRLENSLPHRAKTRPRNSSPQWPRTFFRNAQSRIRSFRRNHEIAAPASNNVRMRLIFKR